MSRLPDCLKDAICINCFDSLPQMFLLHILYVMSKLIVLRENSLGGGGEPLSSLSINTVYKHYSRSVPLAEAISRAFSGLSDVFVAFYF